MSDTLYKAVTRAVLAETVTLDQVGELFDYYLPILDDPMDKPLSEREVAFLAAELEKVRQPC